MQLWRLGMDIYGEIPAIFARIVTLMGFASLGYPARLSRFVWLNVLRK